MENEEKKENKISKEVANTDFENWADALGIDYDTSSMTDEDKSGFEKLKAPIIKAITDGRCVIDGNKIEYTIKTCAKSEGLIGKVVTIDPPSGGIYTGMDGFKETQIIHRLNGAMSAMTALDIGVFNKLDIRDYSFFRAVLQLFLAI